MNRFVKNYPKEPHLFLKKDGSGALLQLSKAWTVKVPGDEHRRLSSLVADTDEGHTVYTTAVLLRPYVDRYRCLTTSDSWSEIRLLKEAVNRVNVAFQKNHYFTLEYVNTVLSEIKISAAVDKSGRIRTYQVPDILFSRLTLWNLPREEGTVSLEGDFSVVLRAGRTFQEVEKAIEVGLLDSDQLRRLKVGDRQSSRIAFRDKLNALYLYVKEHPQAVITNLDALGAALQLCGLPSYEYEHFQNIIGRGSKGAIYL